MLSLHAWPGMPLFRGVLSASMLCVVTCILIADGRQVAHAAPQRRRRRRTASTSQDSSGSTPSTPRTSSDGSSDDQASSDHDSPQKQARRSKRSEDMVGWKEPGPRSLPIGLSKPTACLVPPPPPLPPLPGQRRLAAVAVPLPPPGSYYEYAGQRVLVPDWPDAPARVPQQISPVLGTLVRSLLAREAPRGKPDLYVHSSGRGGLTEWGKEVLLRVKARVFVLQTSDPEAYADVSEGLIPGTV